MKETVLASPIHEAFFQYSDIGMSYLYCGDGSHKFKKYAEDGKALPACLTSIIYRALQNSIRNSKSEDFVPISIEVLTQDIPQIMQEAKDGKNLSEIMKEIDEKIEYEGAKRLSDVEIEQLKKEEATFKKPKPIIMESLVTNALTQNQVRDAQVLQSQASHFYDDKDNKWFYSPKEI